MSEISCAVFVSTYTHWHGGEERGGEKAKRSVSSSLRSGDGGGGEGNYGTGDDVRACT